VAGGLEPNQKPIVRFISDFQGAPPALRRAVKLVTSGRDAAAVMPGDHVRIVWRSKASGTSYDSAAVSAVRKKEVRN
jgi:hypothetical protein